MEPYTAAFDVRHLPTIPPPQLPPYLPPASHAAGGVFNVSETYPCALNAARPRTPLTSEFELTVTSVPDGFQLSILYSALALSAVAIHRPHIFAGRIPLLWGLQLVVIWSFYTAHLNGGAFMSPNDNDGHGVSVAA